MLTHIALQVRNDWYVGVIVTMVSKFKRCKGSWKRQTQYQIPDNGKLENHHRPLFSSTLSSNVIREASQGCKGNPAINHTYLLSEFNAQASQDGPILKPLERKLK